MTKPKQSVQSRGPSIRSSFQFNPYDVTRSKFPPVGPDQQISSHRSQRKAWPRNLLPCSAALKGGQMSIEERDVMFKSGETFAAAWLFLPENGTLGVRVPAVAMAHGLGAVKEMYLEPFARRFAKAGIAALVSASRGLGASGGEPRQRISPHDQMEDYRNALTWLSIQPEIDADRLAVWGTSFSGGHVIQVAAHDSRVKAVVSQAGAMDLNQIVRTVAGPEMLAALQQLTVLERIRFATEGGEKYIPSTGRPGEGLALQSDQDSFDFAYLAQATVAPAWRNQVTMGSLDAILAH